MSNKWNVDKAHSEVNFKVKHMVISTVSGNFLEFDASAESTSESFETGTFSFTAQIDSIHTKNPQRDEHLKSDDFFNAADFPELKFTSEKWSGGNLNGAITIKGVTQPITLEVDFGGVITDPYGNQRAGFEFSGQIKRKEFGLNWDAVMESGGVVVSDNVKFSVNLEFIKESVK